MAKKYDDFDEGDSDGFFDQILNIVSNRKREFAIASVSVAVILLGIVIFGSYPKDEETAANDSVPIVRADAGDYKTAPDNPGGMEIPYRDSTVFSSVEGQKTDGGTENILADDNDSEEQPLPRDKLFAGLNTEGDQPGGAPVDQQAAAPAQTTPTTTITAATPTLDAMPGKAAAVEPPSNEALVKEAIGTNTPESSTSTTPPPAVAMKAAPVEEVARAETPKADAPKKAEPKAESVAKTEPAAGNAAAKGIKPGNYFVQLASVKSTAGASSEYKKMQVKYGSLSGVSYRTQEANLGAKGTFYRIQAGPMSKDSAGSVCNSIKAKGGSCLVVAK